MLAQNTLPADLPQNLPQVDQLPFDPQTLGENVLWWVLVGVLTLQLLLGLLYVFLGYRVFRILAVLVVSLAAAAAAGNLAYQHAGPTAGIIAAGVAGVLGGVLGWFLFWLLAALGGAAFAAGLTWNILLAQGVVVHPAFMLAPAAVGFVLTVLLLRPMLIVLTAYTGAAMVVEAVGIATQLGAIIAMTEKAFEAGGPLTAPPYSSVLLAPLYLAGWLALGTAGAIVQFVYTCRGKRRKPANPADDGDPQNPPPDRTAHPEASKGGGEKEFRPKDNPRPPVVRFVIAVAALAAIAFIGWREHTAQGQLHQARQTLAGGQPAVAAEGFQRIANGYPLTYAAVEARLASADLAGQTPSLPATQPTWVEQNLSGHLSPYRVPHSALLGLSVAVLIGAGVTIVRLLRPAVGIPALLVTLAAAASLAAVTEALGMWSLAPLTPAGNWLLAQPRVLFAVGYALPLVTMLLAMAGPRR